MNDKTLHFFAGVIIAVSITLLSTPLIGAAVGALAGVGKELFDKYIQKEEFDFFDMFFTMAGAWIGVMALHLFQIFILN